MIDVTGHSSKKPLERKLQDEESALDTVFLFRPHSFRCLGAGRIACIRLTQTSVEQNQSCWQETPDVRMNASQYGLVRGIGILCGLGTAVEES